MQIIIFLYDCRFVLFTFLNIRVFLDKRFRYYIFKTILNIKNSNFRAIRERYVNRILNIFLFYF